MRIGIVCHASVGGSGLVATELAVALAARGHQVHLIARQRPFKLPPEVENLEFHQVEAVDYPLFEDSLYTYALTAKIAEVTERCQLDLIHLHYSIPHSLCGHLAREICARKVPLVTTVHGTDASLIGLDPRLFALNRFSLQQNDCLTTVSAQHRTLIEQQFQLEQPIEVIHNFIDPARFSPQRRSPILRRTLAEAGEKILMHVSNFRAPKNTPAVLYAFAHLPRACAARLVLVGDGPDLEALKNLAAEIGISRRVRFLGAVHSVEQLIANADCLIQPSYQESFGMAVLEAMAAEVPTVCSNVGGLPELVVDGETGFLADPDDHGALAEAVEKILSDTALAQRMGRAARQRAATHFSTERQVEAYLGCYQTLVAQGASIKSS